jgi:hypothetical protein
MAQAPLPEQASFAPAAIMTDEETAVWRGHEVVIEALRRGDTGGLARVAADGFSTSGMTEDDRSKPLDITVRQARVEVHGIGAVVTGSATRALKAPDGRHAGEQPVLFSEVWIKRDGEWQLMNVRFASPTQ